MNEIKLVGYNAGATLTAKILDDGLEQVGSSIGLSEISDGFYLADVPQSLALGKYTVVVLDGSSVVGSEAFEWDGSKEVIAGMLYRHPTEWTSMSAVVMEQSNVSKLHDSSFVAVRSQASFVAKQTKAIKGNQAVSANTAQVSK